MNVTLNKITVVIYDAGCYSVHGTLYDDNNSLLISGTLDYIMNECENRGYILTNAKDALFGRKIMKFAALSKDVNIVVDNKNTA